MQNNDNNTIRIAIMTTVATTIIEVYLIIMNSNNHNSIIHTRLQS